MAKKQYFGIRYPFTYQNEEMLYLDLNEKIEDGMLSEILHVVLTPKGQRLRMPQFGTDLIKYIFSQNDQTTWDDVKSEIIRSVSEYVPSASLLDVRIMTDDNDDNKILLYLNYKVKKGEIEEDNKVVVAI